MKNVKKIIVWAMLSIMLQVAGLLFLDQVIFKESYDIDIQAEEIKSEVVEKNRDIDYDIPYDAKDIKVSDIMYVLEGPIEIADCIEGTACDNIDCCATRLLWTKIKNSIDEVMEGITLQDIVDDYNNIKYRNESLILKRSEL